MRIAVISDIHGNFEALERVLDHARQMGVDQFVSLGDVVGYGASPNQCIDLLLSLPVCSAILGNHEAAVLGEPTGMRAEARQTILWTRSVLTRGSLWFLKEMEEMLVLGDIRFCHSTPYRPRRWYYLAEKKAIHIAFARTRAKLIFIGHTHVPIAITRKNFFCTYLRAPRHQMELPVAQCNRQIFNGGSVGQPRDGDPRAAYLIYDSRRQKIEFYRLRYDVERAAEKILASGLPEIFAKRLFTGV